MYPDEGVACMVNRCVYFLLLPVMMLPLVLLGDEAEEDEGCTPVAEVDYTEGEVRIVEEDSPFPKQIEDLPKELCIGMQVQTSEDAKAVVRSERNAISLSGSSTLKIEEGEALEIAEGVALFVVEDHEGDRHEVKTAKTVIGIRGTDFIASSQQDRDDVALFDGEVRVARQDGQEMAYYRIPEPGEMTFEEYREYRQRAFEDFVESFEQDFQDYKDQFNARFEAFVDGVDLEPGRQLTVGETEEKPEAIEGKVDENLEELGRELREMLK
ncbi:FecR family protein [Halorhodospira halochloris]|uniref:FecR family protein n=1 Tax=Halorhodospira halochloris TaxID=1052 RepID=UPI001EE79206|nr:FecR family protein [Halorhodospira halochloris]MCG5549045.1 FecR family protein [Halorhodospira halochloris]